jgi:hypothetical protein
VGGGGYGMRILHAEFNRDCLGGFIVSLCVNIAVTYFIY